MALNFGVVILAAGAAPLRGRPKQLLPYLGRTLIEHAARTALASGAREVVVVVGANAPTIRDSLKGLRVRVVNNSQWTEGIASSIRIGIASLSPDTECAVIALGDQPRITPELLRDLAHKQANGSSPIVASAYDGVVGAPCAFSKELFPTLLSLRGQSGARELIRKSTIPVETINFDAGNVEIEEPAIVPPIVDPERKVSLRDTFPDPQETRGPPRWLVARKPSAA